MKKSQKRKENFVRVECGDLQGQSVSSLWLTAKVIEPISL